MRIEKIVVLLRYRHDGSFYCRPLFLLLLTSEIQEIFGLQTEIVSEPANQFRRAFNIEPFDYGLLYNTRYEYFALCMQQEYNNSGKLYILRCRIISIFMLPFGNKRMPSRSAGIN